MRASSSTTRIVCRFFLLQPLVGLPVPFIKRGRNASPPRITVPVVPSTPPEERAGENEPQQDKEQDRQPEAESPGPIPSVRVQNGRHLPTLSDQLLGQAVREPDVVSHN